MTKRSGGIGEKVLGWFIVEEGAEDEPSSVASPSDPTASEAAPEPIGARSSEPARSGASPTSHAASARPPIVKPGTVHDARAFATVYTNAGVAEEDRERLARVIGLVESLPAEATPDVKRAIVGASLQAFGVPIDRILATSNAAAAALDAYVLEGQRRTKEVLASAEGQIAKLTAEIEEVRRLMLVQQEAQQELARATTIERARVRTAVEFFGGSEDVASTMRSVPQERHGLRRLG